MQGSRGLFPFQCFRVLGLLEFSLKACFEGGAGLPGVGDLSGQVHTKALAAAAKRKAMAKVVMAVAAADPKLRGSENDPKRLRSPNMLSTPSTSTPQPKHLKDLSSTATPKKVLFGAGSTPARR